MKDNDPSIITVEPIPIGTIVTYYGRSGSMRQGRTRFPAVVLKQHPDDGSLDLIVWFEAEDQIWEQRVKPYDENTNPGHAWAPVDKVASQPKTYGEMMQREVSQLGDSVLLLHKRIYGDYNPPEKSVIEYLDDFDKRLTKLENKYRSG